MSRRNIRMALDQAYGLKTMKQLAKEHDMNVSRAGQICLKVRQVYGIPRGEGQGPALGRAILRHREDLYDQDVWFEVNTPKKFYEKNGDRNKDA